MVNKYYSIDAFQEAEMSKLKESIKSVIFKNIQVDRPTVSWLTREEVAKYLKVSLASVDNYVRYGLPKYKLGRSTRFVRDEVDAFALNRLPSNCKFLKKSDEG